MIELNKFLVDESSGGGVKGVYQDIVLDNKVVHLGHRNTLERYQVFDKIFLNRNLKNKTVLDLGCNIGMISNYFIPQGAEVIGIDLNEQFISVAKQLVPKGKFYSLNLNTITFEEFIRQIKTTCFDIVLMLAIWDYLEPSFNTWFQKLKKTCLIFEGHADGEQRIKNCIPYQGRILSSWQEVLEKQLNVKKYSLVQMIDNNLRPIYFCEF